MIRKALIEYPNYATNPYQVDNYDKFCNNQGHRIIAVDQKPNTNLGPQHTFKTKDLPSYLKNLLNDKENL